MIEMPTDILPTVIVGTLTGLWFLHRRNREEKQIKLENYYNEQASRAYSKPLRSEHSAYHAATGHADRVPQVYHVIASSP